MPWQEIEIAPIEDVEFFNFKNIGDQFVGRFVSFEEKEKTFKSDNRTKLVNAYVFQTKDGLVQIDANRDLHARLTAARLSPGHGVAIQRVEDKPSRNPTMSAMAQFKVKVNTDAPKAATALKPAPTAEDDLNF